MENPLQARIDSLTEAIRNLRKDLARSKQAEASLRASEKRFRAFFNDNPVGFAQFAPNGRFLEVNKRFCNMLGYSRNELLERTFLDVTHPSDRAKDQELRQQVLQGKIPRATWEKRYIRKDGSIVWGSLSLSAPRSSDGGMTYLLAAVDNISERRTLQESLSRIATNLAKTEATSLSGTWRWEIDTDTVMASPEVLSLFGLATDLVSVPLDEILQRVHPEDRSVLKEALRLAINEQRPYHLEYRICLPHGEERLVLASGDIYSRDEEGKPLVMVGMVQDITLRRQAERALAESERLFRQLFDNAADGIFIADKDGQYTDVNTSACRMLGYRRDELIGMRITDLIPEEDKERLATARAYFLQDSEHAQVGEWKLQHKNGEFIPVEVNARILPDGRWMAIVRDIGERMRIQRELEHYAEELQDLYDHAPCGYHTLDGDGVFLQINKTELDWLGYDSEELIGKKKVTELLTEESKKKFSENFPKFLDPGRVRDLEVEFIRKDGSILPVMLSASIVFDLDGGIVSSRTTLFDMTELAEAQKKLRQAATVFEHTTDAILITDAGGTIVAVNKAFSQITGYQPEEVIGRNPRILKSDRQDHEFYRSLWSSIEQTGSWQGEIWDRRKSGEHFPAWETITAVRDDSGRITDFISVFSDITTIKATEEKLTQLAYHDVLTGLPNRLLFNDRITQALAHAKRHHTRAALLLLDLDRFKLINDTLGHAAGDQLLQVIAARLKTAIREEDTVARLGGDEFAIILPQVDSIEDAAMFAQKLTKLVSLPLPLSNQMLTISTSVGIGIFPDDALDPETLSKSADMALYGAKDKGRNAYEFYTPEMTRTATETLLIDRDLRHALTLNQLELFYQPQVSLATGRIVGVEALIRWNRPHHGLQLPGRFIPIAEETDLIESIGDWVFDTAWAQLQLWRAEGMPPVRLAINLSVRQIKRPHLVDEIRKKLGAVPPYTDIGLDLEVTETAMQIEPDTVDALRELKALGLNIVIDDFGTGYSSLNSLKHLPVDILKIDRSFIRGIPMDSGDKAIASAIVAMGHSLGMRVVAEGVETHEQLQFVMEQHCDDVQGFLLYPPMPADECGRFLMSGMPIDLHQNEQRMSH
ncbi:PAS domain S-box protein [Noviherbaspirillum sp.]|jgi:diguanylate cyclase (GGDEF)-like protein/PAS domain S-box-containing protein|uniref:PAS domain S-box protein n=1 Tax=Noviherbaspirillum sp. TaxID=1926288 RepID=UPI0025F3EE70|nr:PAS domain S-box protein [Noviherbaspirillum sp.]